MSSTEIALLLQNDTEKIKRIGEIIGKKITVKDDFSALNVKEKTFIYLDILEHHVTQGGFIQFFLILLGNLHMKFYKPTKTLMPHIRLYCLKRL
jgi:hypothetical protein